MTLAALLFSFVVASDAWSLDAHRVDLGYPYVSPVPDSRLVSPWNNIVIRGGSSIDRGSLGGATFSVVGSTSGRHRGELVLSDDSKTLVFLPDEPFSPGERVVVDLDGDVRTLGGETLPPLTFSFSVAMRDPKLQSPRSLEELFPDISSTSTTELPSILESPRHSPEPCDTLPSTYPPIHLITSNNPDLGNVFLAPFRFDSSIGHLLILDNAGMPLFYRRTSSVFDFKKQPNGLLTYFGTYRSNGRYLFRGLDRSYALVDSFAAGNGYITDPHDLQLLPNGHALLMAYDQQPVGMDAVVAGGDPNAIVTGLIVQELDAAKNVVFQWRSWDHFNITDMVECTGLLTDPTIDYVHGNAVELDYDGNLLISSRHMNEITKISRQTGQIMWRFGPNAKNNAFTILQDPKGFSHQHDIRRLPNGNITLFDNGDCIGPPFYSRALEYAIDEQHRIATLVWEHRNSPDIFAPFLGNVQRHANGGTMISWAGTQDPKLTELHADGSKSYEVGFASASSFTYRAFRFEWQSNLFTTDHEQLGFGNVCVGTDSVLPLSIHNNSDSTLPITCFLSSNVAFSVVGAVPMMIPAGGDAVVDVRFKPFTKGDFKGILYVRSVNESELVAQPVVVEGRGALTTVAIDDPALQEGDAGQSVLEFTITVSDGCGRDVTVDYSTTSGTATVEDHDYEPFSGTATIPANSTSTTIAVLVNGDRTPEEHETFFVKLANPIHASLGTKARGMGTILNDDGIATVAAAGVSEFSVSVIPTPSHGMARVGFALPQESRIRLSVLDLQGREVAVLADDIRSAGRHQAIWDSRMAQRPAAAGVYFVRYQTPLGTFVKRLVLMR